MPLSIRDVKREDVREIRKIYGDWWRTPSGMPDENEIKYWAKLVEDSISGEKERVVWGEGYIVAAEGDMLAGILGYRTALSKRLKPFALTPNPMTIHVCLVGRRHQNQGVGSALMLRLEHMAKEKNISEILVPSSSRWKDAWSFYKKLGYSEAGMVEEKSGGSAKIYRKLLA